MKAAVAKAAAFLPNAGTTPHTILKGLQHAVPGTMELPSDCHVELAEPSTCRDNWWVDCEGKTYGPFPSPDEAQQEARRLAKVFGDPSRRCLVFAPGADGHQELVWTGPDPAETT